MNRKNRRYRPKQSIVLAYPIKPDIQAGTVIDAVTKVLDKDFENLFRSEMYTIIQHYDFITTEHILNPNLPELHFYYWEPNSNGNYGLLVVRGRISRKKREKIEEAIRDFLYKNIPMESKPTEVVVTREFYGFNRIETIEEIAYRKRKRWHVIK